jgi:hypothetical protein
LALAIPYKSDRIALFYGVTVNLVIVRNPWFQMIGRRKPSINKAVRPTYFSPYIKLKAANPIRIGSQEKEVGSESSTEREY